MLVSFTAVCSDAELEMKDGIDQCLYMAKKASKALPSFTPMAIVPEHFKDAEHLSAFSLTGNIGSLDYSNLVKMKLKSCLKVLPLDTVEL